MYWFYHVNESEVYKTSFSVFVALLYLKILYILIMTLYILSRFNQQGL